MSVATAQLDPNQEVETPPFDASAKKGLHGVLQCVVVTPEKAVIDEVVEFVALPLYDGELGVGHGHTPLVGRLGFGELRLRKGSTTLRYFVDGGFVQVRDNVVTVLSNRAIPIEQLDAAAAAEELQKALDRRTASEIDMNEKSRAVDRARAMARVAGGRSAGA